MPGPQPSLPQVEVNPPSGVGSDSRNHQETHHRPGIRALPLMLLPVHPPKSSVQTTQPANADCAWTWGSWPLRQRTGPAVCVLPGLSLWSRLLDSGSGSPSAPDSLNLEAKGAFAASSAPPLFCRGEGHRLVRGRAGVGATSQGPPHTRRAERPGWWDAPG